MKQIIFGLYGEPTTKADDPGFEAKRMTAANGSPKFYNAPVVLNAGDDSTHLPIRHLIVDNPDQLDVRLHYSFSVRSVEN